MRVPYPNQGVWFLPSKGKAPARVLWAIRDGRERSSVRSAAHVELGEVPGSRELDLMSTAGGLVIASNEDPMKTSGTIRSIYAGQSMRSRRGRRVAVVCRTRGSGGDDGGSSRSGVLRCGCVRERVAAAENMGRRIV